MCEWEGGRERGGERRRRRERDLHEFIVDFEDEGHRKHRKDDGKYPMILHLSLFHSFSLTLALSYPFPR